MPTPQCARIAHQANGPASARALPQTKSVHTMCDRPTRNVPRHAVLSARVRRKHGEDGGKRKRASEKKRAATLRARGFDGPWTSKCKPVSPGFCALLCPGFTNLEQMLGFVSRSPGSLHFRLPQCRVRRPLTPGRRPASLGSCALWLWLSSRLVHIIICTHN